MNFKSEIFFDNMYSGVYVVDINRKIIYWNEMATKISGYTKEEMINKHCYNNILKHVDGDGNLLCFNGCPLLHTLKTEEIMHAEVFLHHKYGHRVPVFVKSVPIYDDDGNISGAIELFEDSRKDKSVYVENRRLQEQVSTDALTKAYNRSFIDFYLSSLIDEAQQFNTPFGILFIDIDKFKNVNDVYGHNVGDSVLKVVSSTIMSNIRSMDRFGRWGGEEFILIMKINNEQALKKLAEKLRMLIEQSSIIDKENTINVTISIGGLMYNGKDTKDELVNKADTYMYEAKETGRNKVIIKGE